MSDNKARPDAHHDRPLLGSGRAAVVHDLGDGTVLRRYRTARDCRPEAKAKEWVAAAGIAVPTVHRAEGTDLVMDLVVGPTMVADLAERPWMLVSHARTLARIQRLINSVAAPSWLPRGPHIPEGEAVLHLDLHPMNVLLAEDGPVVIDWTNVARGHPDFDAALTFVLAWTADTAGRAEWVGARLFGVVFALARGPRAIRTMLRHAVDHRLADPNVTETERRRLARLGG